MDYLTHNLALLARQQPELAQAVEQAVIPAQAELLPSRQGPPYLRLGGSLLCSSVDPMAEGRRQAAAAPPGPLAVLGFGLGYHLEPLVGRELLVWQPEAGLLKLALAARDLSHLLPGLRLALSAQQLGDLAGYSLLLHGPSARLYPHQAQALERLINPTPQVPARPASPRVLVVGPLYGGTLEMTQWCCQALAELGCQVRTLPLEALEPLYRSLRQSPLGPGRTQQALEPMLRFLGEVVLLAAEEQESDLVLALAQAPLEGRVLARLRRLGAKSAFWFVEDFRARTYFRQVAAAYDHFFHIQGPDMEQELEGLGANGHFLPLAAHPPLHRPLELGEPALARWGAPLGFMGEGYPNRVKLLTNLARTGLGLRIWGTGWPRQGPLAALLAEDGRRLDSQEVVKVYNACQVVLNLHSWPDSQATPDVFDYLNPRTFEVAACGGFQLVARSAGLAAQFVPEKELAVFSQVDELADKAAYYLERPQERWDLAQAARRRVLREHTYYHRMERLLTICLGPAAAQEDPSYTHSHQEVMELMFERLASA